MAKDVMQARMVNHDHVHNMHTFCQTLNLHITGGNFIYRSWNISATIIKVPLYNFTVSVCKQQHNLYH